MSFVALDSDDRAGRSATIFISDFNFSEQFFFNLYFVFYLFVIDINLITGRGGEGGEKE